MREKLAVINGFLHDVATGTWLASLLLVSFVETKERHPELAAAASPVLATLQRETMVITWVSLAVILMTGFVRMLTFKVFGWTGDIAAERVRLLKIKHALLGTAFLAGTIWMVVLVYL